MLTRSPYKVIAVSAMFIVAALFVMRANITKETLPVVKATSGYTVKSESGTTSQFGTHNRKYVSLCRERLVGDHRTGNHLFFLASMLHVACVTGRTLVMPRTGWYLDRIFQLDILRYDDVEKQICPCKKLYLPRYNYDQRFDDPKFVESLSRTGQNLLICGLSQTYRYAKKNEYELRRLLRFSENVSNSAVRFLSGLHTTLPRIGVHVRRGDFLQSDYRIFGLTVADSSYFRSAFRYFTDLYGPVNFVVATEDRNWTVMNLPRNTSIVRINFTDFGIAAFDLAVLSKCDVIIMSTGSFGWWAAWIANKTSVYYREWPRNGSRFYSELNKENYFPPHWVPL